MIVSDILRNVVVLFAIIQTCDGLRCYNCQDMPDPRYCLHVTNCTAGEICYTEEAITASGDIVFHTGCMHIHTGCMHILQCGSIGRRSGDITACMTCCSGDYCNNAGCGVAVIPRDQRGPYCFSCDATKENHQCNKVVTCAKNEICSLYTPHDYAALPELVLQTSCMSQTRCNSLHSVTTNTRCAPTCCDADFCNDRCNASSLQLHGTPSPTAAYTSTQAAYTTKQAVYTTTQAAYTTTQAAHTTTQAAYTTTQAAYTTKQAVYTTTQAAHTTTQAAHTTTQAAYTTTQAAYTTSQAANTTTQAAYTTTQTAYTTSQAAYTTTTQGNVHCPSDHHHDYTTGLCIKIFFENDNSWTVAQDKCAAIGDTLVTIDTQQKMTYIYNYLAGHNTKGFFWIGGLDKFNNNTFYWPNGHRFSYSNWGGGSQSISSQQPDHVDHGHNHQDCVGIYHEDHYRWHDDTCSDGHSYICEHSSTLPISAPFKCVERNGYVDLEHVLCVHIHDDHKQVTWDQARDICQREHAVLVVLDSRAKSDALRHYLDKHDRVVPFWIGALDTYQNDTFYWVTGQPVTFADWYVDPAGTHTQPEHVTYKSVPEDCVGVYPYPHKGSPHHWHDDDCSRQRSYICQHL